MTYILTNEVVDTTQAKPVSTSWINTFVPTLLKPRQGQRFIRFSLSGLTGLFVNMGVLYVLREFGNLGLTRSAIMAIELAIINNFFWNDLWTFQDIARQNKGLKERGKRFFKFNLVCLSGLILNVLIINALYNLADINEYSANLIAIAAVTFWNFWFNLKISWKLPTCESGKLENCQ